MIIRRAVGRCPAGSGWRWAGGGRIGGGMDPGLNGGEAARCEGLERLALMDRPWEDAIEETDYATQDGLGGGPQGSEEMQHERSGQASDGAGEAGWMASRLLESMEDAALSVEDILAEWDPWDEISSPGPEGEVWTQERSGASPEQALALAEEGVATLMGASRRVASLLEGAVVNSYREGDDWVVNYRPPGGLGTHRQPWGWDPKQEQRGTTVVAQVWSALLKFAATSQGIQCKGFRHMELTLGAEGCRRKLVTSAQVQMRATQSIILSLSGQALGVPAVARVGRLSWDRVLE
ncbi:hypothetical protein CYMTET_37813 [Cymbomonas tetramitiformis]|uniref:Uncharacterized protein n=1 Tax=Cymbomonas tetramitiformis TaxID=36881 RepID=A0AAE0F699_9CHLO|nr:hypothetical protein CYMTET_37813 [Cymbomonas tetramitiformis]